jgi:hypothetical protein
MVAVRSEQYRLRHDAGCADNDLAGKTNAGVASLRSELTRIWPPKTPAAYASKWLASSQQFLRKFKALPDPYRASVLSCNWRLAVQRSL